MRGIGSTENSMSTDMASRRMFCQISTGRSFMAGPSCAGQTWVLPNVERPWTHVPLKIWQETLESSRSLPSSSLTSAAEPIKTTDGYIISVNANDEDITSPSAESVATRCRHSDTRKMRIRSL